MFEQSLDISFISCQPTERANKCNQLDTLKELLNEFSKQETTPEESSIHTIKAPPVRTLTMSPTQTISWVRLTVDPIICSSNPAKLTPKSKVLRKDIKGMTAPVIECISTRSSIEMMPEADSKFNNPLLSPVSASGSPVNKFSFTHRKGSCLLGSDLKMDSIHIRRPSSPSTIGQIQSPSKVTCIGAINPLANLTPNAPINNQRDTSIQSIKLRIPDSVGNSFIASPKSDKSPMKQKSIQLKLDSPKQEPIIMSGEYLPKVLHRRGGSFVGSHPGSSTESPKSDGNSEKGKYKFTRRGSFSMFRKTVENELVQNA